MNVGKAGTAKESLYVYLNEESEVLFIYAFIRSLRLRFI